MKVMNNQIIASDNARELVLYPTDPYARIGSPQKWTGIAVSTDGKYQSAIAMSSAIWISSDYGKSFRSTSIIKMWQSIRMSIDGKYQLACASTRGSLFLSSDFGVNWDETGPVELWTDTAVSSSGHIQTAVITNGPIYISNNFGDSWTITASVQEWKCIAMSGTGQYHTASVNKRYLWISSDYGYTWLPNTFKTDEWTGISISDTGEFQTVIATSAVYISLDYGVSWESISTEEALCTGIDYSKKRLLHLKDVDMSSTGEYQIIADYGGVLCVSKDYGKTWDAKGLPKKYVGVAISGDANYETAVVTEGYINVFTKTPMPTLRPSSYPTFDPTFKPSIYKSHRPSSLLTRNPTSQHSKKPSAMPSRESFAEQIEIESIFVEQFILKFMIMMLLVLGCFRVICNRCLYFQRRLPKVRMLKTARDIEDEEVELLELRD